MSAGVKNNADDGASHKFVLNVVPAAASVSIFSSYGCSGTDINSCVALENDMAGWVTFPAGVFTVQINSVGYRDITITIPDDAKTGTYQFDAVVCCTDCADYAGSCTTDNLNWGGSAQPIQIIVE